MIDVHALLVGDEVIITGMGFAGVRGVIVELDVMTPFGLCHKVERSDGSGTGLFELRYLTPAHRTTTGARRHA